MTLEQLQQAIATFRAAATTNELEQLAEMLRDEAATAEESVEEEILDIENEIDDEVDQDDWLTNQINLWYNTPEKVCNVYGDRRKPGEFSVTIQSQDDWRMQEEVVQGTIQDAMKRLEAIVGTGSAFSKNPAQGAKSWVYRWYNYTASTWLT